MVSGRVYPRKFDWDEARRRNAKGESYLTLAREYGVTDTAVRRVCDSRVRERMEEANYRYQKSGVCRDCGKQGVSPYYGRCMKCAHLAAATSVRPDSLECISCREWKPDEAFTKATSQIARRGRHKQCSSCQTAAKRDWRKRNREKARAYDREYRRQRRAAA